MSDFENKPIKDAEGKILRYSNGKPILYKHFLNDLPDENEEVFSNLTAKEQVAYFERIKVDVPESLRKRAEEE